MTRIDSTTSLSPQFSQEVFKIMARIKFPDFSRSKGGTRSGQSKPKHHDESTTMRKPNTCGCIDIRRRNNSSHLPLIFLLKLTCFTSILVICHAATEGPKFQRLSRISTGDIGDNQDKSNNNSEINNASMERKKYLTSIRKYVNHKRRANSSTSNNYSHSHDSISIERTTLSRNIFGGVNDDDRHNKEPKEENKSNPPSPPEYTYHPSAAPTSVPTFSPTDSPTRNPSSRPTLPPSHQPTSKPTKSPSTNPTQSPTHVPTKSPPKPTQSPTKKIIVSTPTSSPVFQKQCNLLQFGNTTGLEPTILTFSYEIETDPDVPISVTDDVVPCVEGAISSMLAASLSFKDVDTDVDATGASSTLIYKNDRRMLTEIVGLSSQPEDTLEKDCEYD